MISSSHRGQYGAHLKRAVTPYKSPPLTPSLTFPRLTDVLPLGRWKERTAPGTLQESKERRSQHTRGARSEPAIGSLISDIYFTWLNLFIRCCGISAQLLCRKRWKTGTFVTVMGGHRSRSSSRPGAMVTGGSTWQARLCDINDERGRSLEMDVGWQEAR